MTLEKESRFTIQNFKFPCTFEGQRPIFCDSYSNLVLTTFDMIIINNLAKPEDTLKEYVRPNY